MKINKLYLVIGGWLVVTVVLLLLFLNNSNENPQAGYTKVNSDTGQEVYTNPNKGVEQDAINGEPVLLGFAALTDNGFTQNQVNFVKDGLVAYSAKYLDNKYTSLTLRPQELVVTANQISTKIRIGDTENLLPITIRYWNLYYVQISIEDSSGTFGGNYDSGVLPYQPTSGAD